MKALVIDDEVHCREVICGLLNDFCPDVKLIEEAKNVATGLGKIKKLNPDIVFLDIQLQEQTGFDLLNELEEINFQLVFITAYDNYAIKAFEYSAMHYLLKPVSPQMIEDAVARYRKNKLNYPINTIKKARGFYLKTTANSYHIIYDEIAYIKADGSYSTIYTIEGESIFTSKRIGEYKSLPLGHFFRIHNSTVVNLEFVQLIDDRSNKAVLRNEVRLSISRRRKSSFKKALKDFRGD